MRWLTLFIIGFIIGTLYDVSVGYFAKRSPKSKILHLKIKKLRIHHTVGALVLIVIYLFTSFALLLGMGIGGIISHSIRERSLLFVEYKGKRYF